MRESLRVHMLVLLLLCVLVSPVAAVRSDLPAGAGNGVGRSDASAVRTPMLAILNTDLPNTITPGGRYTIAVQVANRGEERVTRTVKYVFDGQEVLSAEVTLSPGEKDTAVYEVTLEMIEQSVGDVSAGMHSNGFVTENGAEYTRQVSVRTQSTSGLRVENARLPDIIRPGETFTLSATVVNTGETPVTRTLVYTFSGNVAVVKEGVTIEPGESKSVRFPGITLEIIRKAADVPSVDDGTYTHAIGVKNGPQRPAQVQVVGVSAGSTGQTTGDEDSIETDAMNANSRPQRGFLTNGESRFPILSNVMNLTVLGFLLSVAGIFHQLLTGQ